MGVNMEILEILAHCERIHERELMKIRELIIKEEARVRNENQIPLIEDDDTLGCGS